MKQAETEAELGRSYPLYSEMKFASETANGPQTEEQQRNANLVSTFIYSRDRGQPGKPNPKTGLNK